MALNAQMDTGKMIMKENALFVMSHVSGVINRQQIAPNVTE